MKTKLSLFIVLALCGDSCYANDTPAYRKAFDEAKHYGAKTKIAVCVSDEHGIPVSNATVSAVLNPSWNAREYKTVSKETETNGIAVLEGTTIFPYIGGVVNKDGYYQSGYKLRFGDPSLHDNGGESSKPYYASKVKDGRWLPWNPTAPVILREIRNPIPMYVKRFEGRVPNEPVVGFDCNTGDFVAPHGHGETADFLIHTREMRLSAIDQDGGFFVLPSHSNSAFKSEYLAPEDGYATNLSSKVVANDRNGRTESVLYDYGDDYGLSRNYLLFKSRIKRDPDGKIISANYGKLYGKFEYWRESVKFLYYFNPTPNDRNLEFDGTNNLFRPGGNSKLNWSREP